MREKNCVQYKKTSIFIFCTVLAFLVTTLEEDVKLSTLFTV
jgi:hypothetical protein